MKRPRHYFADIKARPRIEWKEAILKEVPAHYQEWVRKYLRMFVEKQRK